MPLLGPVGPRQVNVGLARVRIITGRGIRIDLLVNNAGVIVGKTFVDHLPDEMQPTMSTFRG